MKALKLITITFAAGFAILAGSASLSAASAAEPVAVADPTAMITTAELKAVKAPAASKMEQRIKRLIKKLRKMNAPAFLLSAAEKVARLAMLHRVDQHLLIVLRDLEHMAQRLDKGDATLIQIKADVAEHNRRLSNFELRFAEQNAAIARLNAATARFNAAVQRAEEAADRADELAGATNKRLERVIARTRRHRPCREFFARRNGRCVDVRLHPTSNSSFRPWTD